MKLTNDILKSKLEDLSSSLSFPEINSSFVNVECPLDQLLDISQKLKSDEALNFDFLFCLTAIDRPEFIEVIYHLRSSRFGHEMVLRVKTNGRENPEVASVFKIWATAEFHEREVYDLFGVKFRDHPDLRRIFLDDDWNGFPLRKDYVDDVNIVSL